MAERCSVDEERRLGTLEHELRWMLQVLRPGQMAVYVRVKQRVPSFRVNRERDGRRFRVAWAADVGGERLTATSPLHVGSSTGAVLAQLLAEAHAQLVVARDARAA